MRSKPAYSECRIFIDGLPQLAIGNYIVTSGGSAYRVQEMRPSPSNPQRRYLKCLRWPLEEIPEDATVYTLRWYRRNPKRAVSLNQLAARSA